jgi:hypothetical protein
MCEVLPRAAIPVFAESVTGKTTASCKNGIPSPERGDSFWTVLLHGVRDRRTADNRTGRSQGNHTDKRSIRLDEHVGLVSRTAMVTSFA